MKKWLPNVTTLTLCSIALTACSVQDKKNQNTTKNSDVQEVTIGAVLPFSGGLEIFGNQAKAGIELAVTEINDAGGIDGRPLKVIYEDNKTDPVTSVEKVSKLIRKDKVLSIIGPITSHARDSMTTMVNQYKTPLLYATNYEGGACNEYIYSFNTVPNQELEKLIPEMAKNVGDSFYLFGTDYVWPQKMFERAEQEIKKVGATVSGKEFTPWAVKDFTPAIRKIMASDAKVLVLAVPGVDGTTFIKQANKLGLTKQMSIAFLGFSETYIPEFGDTTNIDMWTAVPFISTMQSSQPFVESIKSNNASIPGVSHYARTHYNAVKAFAHALDTSKDFTTAGVAKGLKNLKVDAIDINAENHANLNMFIGKLKDGKLQIFKDLGKQNAQSGCLETKTDANS